MSQVYKISIPVKMGSKNFKIKYEYSMNDFKLCAPQLIEIALKKLYPKTKKFDQLKKTYTVFENVLGVERMIENRENILNILANQLDLNCKICFAIRKNGMRHVNQTLDARKCYERLRKIRKEDLVIKDQLKDDILHQIIQNEIILDEQLKKIETIDTVLLSDKTKCAKKNIFQSIYTKMRIINHKKILKKNIDLNRSKVMLLDSTGECTSSSSSPNSSFSRLDTLF